MPGFIDPGPLIDAFGEDILWSPQGGPASTIQGVVTLGVELVEGDTQYYGTVLDLPRTVGIKQGDFVEARGQAYEVTRAFLDNDENWIRAVIAARRSG